ncbi:MAG: hypothetical protein KDI79_15685 [Anaerolineae bacterium]|nr:hypothetical protein [Anaerolineae bacterium]
MFNPESFIAVSKEQHKDRLRKWEQEQLAQQATMEEKASVWKSFKKQLAKIIG